MIKTIFKFPIDAIDLFYVDMPEGAEILSVQVQHETPCFWALVDATAPTTTRTFVIHGTGHAVTNPEEKKFIGTFQLKGGLYVFHLFEVVDLV